MQDRRRFTNEFKRQVIEELLSGISSPAKISRKYEISGGLLYHWKRRYQQGKLDNESNHPEALKERIRELERMVGQLAMDNDFLKKTLARSLEAVRKRESLLPLSVTTDMDRSKGGAK
jgi:transposase-like protein